MYDEPCMQWGAGVSVLASWGEGPESGRLVMIVKNVWLQSEALFRIRRQVSFYSRMKPLVDNLLRLNTEEGRLVIVETEF